MFVKHLVGAAFALLLIPPCIAATPGTDNAAAAACQGQVRSRKATSGPQVKIVKPGVICFGGDIDKESAGSLISATKTVPLAHSVELVVQGSDGGDLASALEVAETLSERKTTVIANGVCGSSCANYLWLMADHRVITKRGLLIFHGGATLALLPDLYAQIEKLAKVHPDINADEFKKKERTQIINWTHRQDRLLTRAGVNPKFFELFNRLGDPKTIASEPSDCRAHPDAKYVVFSPNFLKSQGVTIDINHGPQTSHQVHSYLKNISKNASKDTCFWN